MPLRAAGIALLLVAPTVHNARRRMLHWRAWMFEEQSSMLLTFEDAGSLVAFAGVAALEVAAGIARSHTRGDPVRSTPLG